MLDDDDYLLVLDLDRLPQNQNNNHETSIIIVLVIGLL